MYQFLTKGLAIYRQKHTKSIYVRLRIDGKEIKRSLKTSDIEEAKSRAWRLKFEYEGRLTAGLPIEETKVLSIKSAFLQVIKELDTKRKQIPIYDDYRTVINNYITPYFKNKNIKDLTSKNIRLYFETLDLSLTRKRVNNTCFKKVFQYLEEEEYLKKSEIPTLPKIEANMVENREAFTESDHKIIKQKLADFYTIGKPNFKTKEYRQSLYHYFNFLCETGVRPGEEVNHLTYKDITKNGRNYFVNITKGKTKGYSKGRKIPLSRLAVESLIQLAKIQNPDKEINDKIFLNINRPILEASFGKIPCFISVFKQFNDYMEKENLISQRYTLYCCRHYYITKKLLDGVEIYLLSKYVGNSIDMIQRFYDHHIISKQDNINQLTGVKPEVQF